MARQGRSLLLIMASFLLAIGAMSCSVGAPPATTGGPAISPTAPGSAPSASAAAAPAGATSGSGGEIRIGGLFNVTGLQAAQGQLYANAANLAVNQINEAGGINGKKLSLISEDAQSSNPGALASLQRSIEVDKSLVLLGFAQSTQVQSASDAVKAAGIPMAMGATAVKNTHMDNSWMFRVRPDDSVAAAAMVQYIKDDMKLTKIGIINSAEAFGQGGGALVEQFAKEQGLTVVKRVEAAPGTKDYTAQLLSIKDAGAEVMVMYVVASEDEATIAQQYRTLGAPYKVIGSPGLTMVDTLKLAGDAVVGMYAVMDYMPGVTDQSKKYGADYQKAYGQPADSIAAFNYDAIYLFANAIKKVGEDRAKIKDAILGIRGDWAAVCGTYNFSSNGDGLHANSVVQIQPGGTFKFIKTVNVEPKP